MTQGATGGSSSTVEDATTDRIEPVDPHGNRPAALSSDSVPMCSVCGLDNHPERVICAGCGRDLASGDPLPRRLPDELPTRTHPRGIAGTLQQWWLPVIAGLTVTAIVVLGLALAGIGPFATGRTLSAAMLDPGVYAEERVILELSDVATLSNAGSSDGRMFTPAQMVDDNPDTAWRSDGDVARHGIGEMVDLFLARPSWVEMLVIRNGDHFDAEAYAATARAHRVLVTFDGDVSYVLNLLDQGREFQAVELPQPILTTTVRLEILEVFPGERTQDLAISDLELRGRVAAGDDVDLAIERAEISPAASD